MKKELKLLAMLILFLVCSFVIYYYLGPKTKPESIIEIEQNDGDLFKEEYEDLNGEYLEVTIDELNIIEYIDVEEVLNIIDTDTGIILLSSPKSDASRYIIPLLFEAADTMGIEKISYFDPSEIIDEKTIVDDEVQVIKEGSMDYYYLVEQLNNYLPFYEEINTSEVKRIYLPTVIFVKEGGIIDVYNFELEELNNEEQVEIVTYFEGMINDVYDLVCDEDC